MELPPLFLSRMRDLLGEEFPAFLSSYDAPPVSGLRLNTLKVTSDEFSHLSPWTLEPVPWTDAGFILPAVDPGILPPGKHPYHAAGLYYLQDPSAMMPAETLSPQPGERVLDLAAAPGGKATHLAALLQGQGLLVANEIHPRRVWDLAENLERWGTPNGVVINESPERIADHFGAYFDRVLLDAPCSGEGLFRKTPAARREWSPALVDACALRQDILLTQAARLVRPGGGLVYSTCTFSTEENEAVISRFLSHHLDFSPTPLSQIHNKALSFGSASVPPPSSPFEIGEGRRGPLGLRLYPHRISGEGHFIALLHRHSGEPHHRGSAAPRPSPRQPASIHRVLHHFYDFARSTFSSDYTQPDLSSFTLNGSYLYAQSPDLPSLDGLKVIHPGLWLGIIKKDRFEPSHSLALSLLPPAAQRVLVLPPDSPAVQAYLHGETLPAAGLDGGDGWVLVALCGADGAPRFPLGWGKRSGSLVKNYYPKGLRQY